MHRPAKTTSRLLWLAHATKSHGKLVLDAGAVTAILERGRFIIACGSNRC
jgi:glutamate 5-kinase